jgi:hypothetical protein
MKKEIQIFKIPPRQNIKGMLRGILNIDEIIEKLVNDGNEGDDFYFLYEKVNNKMFYGIYTFKELNNKISGFGKYIKPFKELSALVDKIYNETYGFNRLVETAINHEIFCTSINVDFFNEELRKLLNKVNINFDIRPGVLEEYISFDTKNKTFTKFSTIGNYKKTKKFKVDSRIFIEAVKRVLEKYYDTHIKPVKPVKNNSDDSNDWWDDWCEGECKEVVDTPVQKSVYYLMEENKKGKFILPITFEDEESAEKHIRDYLSIPETIGSTISIMKKGKSLTNEIQIKELTDG